MYRIDGNSLSDEYSGKNETRVGGIRDNLMDNVFKNLVNNTTQVQRNYNDEVSLFSSLWCSD